MGSLVILSLAFRATAATIGSRQSTAAVTATVNLASTHGEAQFHASNFIYGFPDNGTSPSTSIPDSLVTEIKFNACRAGGAQTSNGAGWMDGGYSGYLPRFESTLSNYRTTEAFGGDEFILLLHDLWGADGSATDTDLFPGDDGDWTEMEIFLAQVISDVTENSMLGANTTTNLIFDIWNEPDGSGFWSKTWYQYLDYYNRATFYLRDALADEYGSKLILSGPSMAEPPNNNSSVWNRWVSSVAEAGTAPDHYSWHQLSSPTVDGSMVEFEALRAAAGLDMGDQIDVNEYGKVSEQHPGASAWYIAQLERYEIVGLRANWGSGEDLHDYMGNMVYASTDDSGVKTYFPTGEWWVYKYYADMTGERAVTTASGDEVFDVYATIGTENDVAVVKLLAGVRSSGGTYDITLSGMSSLGLSTDGEVEVHTRQFLWEGLYTEVGEPTDLGTAMYSYTSDSLTISVDTSISGDSTFAFEFYGA